VPDVDPAALLLDLPDGFRFLFVFNFLWTPARRTRRGSSKRSLRAFAPGEGPQLIIKTLHGGMRLMGSTNSAGRTWADDVHIAELGLSVAERDGLMAAWDGYVSLYRADGFGLTIAEATALGKPGLQRQPRLHDAAQQPAPASAPCERPAAQ
jgi:hypothetical protein